MSAFLLVARRVYSQFLGSYWSHVGYTRNACLPIGRMWGIFAVSGFLLVTRRVYSQCRGSYWSHVGYILSVWVPIGRPNARDTSLVNTREYCQTNRRPGQVDGRSIYLISLFLGSTLYIDVRR